jgi:hypothetical protein
VMKRRVAFAKDPKRGSMTRDTVIELRFEWMEWSDRWLHLDQIIQGEVWCKAHGICSIRLSSWPLFSHRRLPVALHHARFEGPRLAHSYNGQFHSIHRRAFFKTTSRTRRRPFARNAAKIHNCDFFQMTLYDIHGSIGPWFYTNI